MEQLTPATALESMTEHRSRLRSLLERFDRAALADRPSNGDWSAIENIRHALYAEQHHLGRFTPGGLGLSPLGLPQGRHAAITAADDPRTDLNAIFEVWDTVHAQAAQQVDFTLPKAAEQLFRLARHQNAHGLMAARALTLVTGEPVRVPKRPRQRA